MKKSLFEKIGLVKSEGDDFNPDSYQSPTPEPVDMLPEDTKVSDLESVSNIYEKGGLGDLSKSIYKVEEIRKALPTNLPKESMKVSVLGLMPLSGLDQTAVIEDANKRLVLLGEAFARCSSETENIVYNNENNIAELENTINELKKEISDRKLYQDNFKSMVEGEATKINNTVKFLTEE
jgi:hypothetical protein